MEVRDVLEQAAGAAELTYSSRASAGRRSVGRAALAGRRVCEWVVTYSSPLRFSPGPESKLRSAEDVVNDEAKEKREGCH